MELGKISIKELVRTATERRVGSLGFAEAMLIYYNKKTHINALNWDKLYANKISADTKKKLKIHENAMERADDANEQLNIFGE